MIEVETSCQLRNFARTKEVRIEAPTYETIYGIEENNVSSNIKWSETDEIPEFEIFCDTEFYIYKDRIFPEEVVSMTVDYVEKTIKIDNALMGCECFNKIIINLRGKEVYANDPSNDKFILNRTKFIDMSPYCVKHSEKKVLKCLQDVLQLVSIRFSILKLKVEDFVFHWEKAKDCNCKTELMLFLEYYIENIRNTNDLQLSDTMGLFTYKSKYEDKVKTQKDLDLKMGGELCNYYVSRFDDEGNLSFYEIPEFPVIPYRQLPDYILHHRNMPYNKLQLCKISNLDSCQIPLILEYVRNAFNLPIETITLKKSECTDIIVRKKNYLKRIDKNKQRIVQNLKKKEPLQYIEYLKVSRKVDIGCELTKISESVFQCIYSYKGKRYFGIGLSEKMAKSVAARAVINKADSTIAN